MASGSTLQNLFMLFTALTHLERGGNSITTMDSVKAQHDFKTKFP